MKVKDILKVIEGLDEDTEVIVYREWEYVTPIDQIEEGYYFPDSGDAMGKESFEEEREELVKANDRKEPCVLLYTD